MYEFNFKWYPVYQWKWLSITRRRRIHFLDRIEGVSHKFNVRLKSLRHDPKQQHATLWWPFRHFAFIRLTWCIINLLEEIAWGWEEWAKHEVVHNGSKTRGDFWTFNILTFCVRFISHCFLYIFRMYFG